MSTVHETAYPVLPAEVGEDELRKVYTPSAAEIRFVGGQFRQAPTRVLILTQLKLLQRLGYMPPVSDVPPAIIELEQAADLREEVFGPILHVVRWRAEALDALLEEIAANRYALTLGIHSRIDRIVQHIAARLPHGNIYVNRNMIGAVVGTQPFGGSGLSGTGPKAGGPGYLRRFAAEQVLTVNTAATGGNASLLTTDE